MFKMIWFRGFGDDPIESHCFGSNGDDHLGTHCGWTMSALGCWCGISGATKTAVFQAGEKLFSALDTTFVFYNHPDSRNFPQGKMAAKIGEPQSQGSHLGSSIFLAGALSIAIRTCTPSLLHFGSFLESWRGPGGERSHFERSDWKTTWIPPKSRWSHGMTKRRLENFDNFGGLECWDDPIRSNPSFNIEALGGCLEAVRFFEGDSYLILTWWVSPISSLTRCWDYLRHRTHGWFVVQVGSHGEALPQHILLLFHGNIWPSDTIAHNSNCMRTRWSLLLPMESRSF